MPNTHTLNTDADARPQPHELPDLNLNSLWHLNSESRARLIQALQQALLTPGFFCSTQVGIPHELTRRVIGHMEQFFSLSDDHSIKQATHNRHHNSNNGWSPMFAEPAYQPGTIAHVESFDCGAPEAGRNLWPEIPGFRQDIEAYWYAAKALNVRLFNGIAEALGLPSEVLSQHAGPTAPCTLRLLHYPGNTPSTGSDDVGIAAHTDFECCTLMYQTAPGLELTDRDGDWVRPSHKEHQHLVILGDMLERFTNGYLKATGHRVPHGGEKRYSIIVFFALDGDYLVRPHPKFVTADNPERYQPITQSEHIAQELHQAELNRQS